MKSFWNPFTAYCAAGIFVVLVYSLGFSSLYPSLSVNVGIFLAVALISAVSFALFVRGIPLGEARIVFSNFREWTFAAIFIAGFVGEFVYSGGVPLIQALSSGLKADYIGFGIPTFHVFLVGTSSFFSVFWWDSYLCSRDRRFLPISLIALVANLLMFSRGGVLIQIFAFIFAFGNRRGLLRKALVIGGLAIAIVLGFGYLGEVRMGSRAENLILSIGGANDKFFNSKLPDSTFWFYIYMSSPLANLQYTELHRASDGVQWIGVIADGLPDFISKYFIPPDKVDEMASLRISDQLTVGTAYARPLLTLGWAGPYALHCAFLLFAYWAMKVSHGSRYYASVLALLCAQGSLMFFDNMLVFAGSLTPILVGLTLAATQRLGFRQIDGPCVSP